MSKVDRASYTRCRVSDRRFRYSRAHILGYSYVAPLRLGGARLHHVGAGLRDPAGAGIDGTFARRARVKEVIPWFDGSVVDIVIDYLTWTFIPAVFMYLRVPMGPKPVASILLIVILVSSMFCYANEGEKSSDNYFVGFPAAWNIVAVMVWVLGTPAWLNIVVTIILAGLTLVPTYYIHPVRTAWLLVAHPARPLTALVLSIGGGLWLLVVGVLRSVQGQDRQFSEAPADVSGAAAVTSSAEASDRP